MRKDNNKISSIAIHALIFYSILISTWGYSENFTDRLIIPKWYFSMFGLLLATIIFSTNKILGQNCHVCANSIKFYIIFTVCTQAVYELLLKFGLHITSFPYTEAGFFENSAGFASCMSIGFPFIMTLSYNRKKLTRIIGYILLTTIAISTALSTSRTGIISIATICTILSYLKLRHTNKLLKHSPLLILILLLPCCYWIKKDSADGRLLIWKCSTELFTKSPLWGYGIGGFEAHYMDIQANYFRTNGFENHFAMLAGNTKFPFNEYLNLALTSGLIGLLILFLFLIWLYMCYKRNTRREKHTAFYALLSIITFSFFSYPFTYPFTWIVCIFCIIFIISENREKINFKPCVKRTMYIIILISSFFCTTNLLLRMHSERKWVEANDLALSGKKEMALSLFKEIKGTFDTCPYFLYNYAIMLQECGMYEKSLEIALSCNNYWSDYDLELVLGENYTHTGNFKKAEAHYLQASWMCPSRFLPLYKLLLLYTKKGHNKKAREISIQIIQKPIKHKTPEILLIKREAEITLKRIH